MLPVSAISHKKKYEVPRNEVRRKNRATTARVVRVHIPHKDFFEVKVFTLIVHLFGIGCYCVRLPFCEISYGFS